MSTPSSNANNMHQPSTAPSNRRASGRLAGRVVTTRGGAIASSSAKVRSDPLPASLSTRKRGRSEGPSQLPFDVELRAPLPQIPPTKKFKAPVRPIPTHVDSPTPAKNKGKPPASTTTQAPPSIEELDEDEVEAHMNSKRRRTDNNAFAILATIDDSPDPTPATPPAHSEDWQVVADTHSPGDGNFVTPFTTRSVSTPTLSPPPQEPNEGPSGPRQIANREVSSTLDPSPRDMLISECTRTGYRRRPRSCLQTNLPP